MKLKKLIVFLLVLGCIGGTVPGNIAVAAEEETEINWLLGSPDSPASAAYASFSDYEGLEYPTETITESGTTLITGSAASPKFVAYKWNNANIAVDFVEDGSLGKPVGDRSLRYTVVSGANASNKIDMRAIGRAADSVNVKAYVFGVKIRLNETAKFSVSTGAYTTLEGTDASGRGSHEHMVVLENGTVSYVPVSENAADGAGTTASSMTPVSEYNTGQWYDLTLVFRGVNGGMLGKELAVYDVYLDGKQIITAAPFCQTNGKVNQSSIQQLQFTALRALSYCAQSGEVDFDDFQVFQVLSGSISADTGLVFAEGSGYSVNEENGTIVGISQGTTVAELKSKINLNTGEGGQRAVSVYSADNQLQMDDAILLNGMKVVITAPNTVSQRAYTVTGIPASLPETTNFASGKSLNFPVGFGASSAYPAKTGETLATDGNAETFFNSGAEEPQTDEALAAMLDLGENSKYNVLYLKHETENPSTSVSLTAAANMEDSGTYSEIKGLSNSEDVVVGIPVHTERYLGYHYDDHNTGSELKIYEIGVYYDGTLPNTLQLSADPVILPENENRIKIAAVNADGETMTNLSQYNWSFEILSGCEGVSFVQDSGELVIPADATKGEVRVTLHANNNLISISKDVAVDYENQYIETILLPNVLEVTSDAAAVPLNAAVQEGIQVEDGVEWSVSENEEGIAVSGNELLIPNADIFTEVTVTAALNGREVSKNIIIAGQKRGLENLALNKNVRILEGITPKTTANNTTPNSRIEHIVGGDYERSFFGTVNGSGSIEIDLGEEKSLDLIRVIQDIPAEMTMRVSVSSDGTHYQQLTEFNGGVRVQSQKTTPVHDARYIQLTYSGAGQVEINQIEAFYEFFGFEPKLMDKSGMEIEEFESGEVSFGGTVYSYTDEDVTADVMFALYTDDILTEIKHESITIPANREAYVDAGKHVIEVPADRKNCSVRAFVWKQDTIEPLVSPVVYTPADDTVELQGGWESFLKRNNMIWSQMPTKWEEGPYTGNGFLGNIMFENENGLDIEVSRTDTYDDRTGYVLYTRYRLRNGNFHLGYVGQATGGTMELALYDAMVTGSITTDKGSIDILSSFTHANDDVIVFELQTEGEENNFTFEWEPDLSTSPRDMYKDPNPNTYLPYPEQTQYVIDGVNVSVQMMPAGEEYAVTERRDGQYATAWKVVDAGDNRKNIYISEKYNVEGSTAMLDAVNAVKQAMQKDLEELKAEHRHWWHNYYKKSYVSLPDKRMENYFWIQMYKMGSISRENSPIVDLQGPWVKKDSQWPAVWWNLNIQSTYAPYFISGHGDVGSSCINALNQYQDILKYNANGAINGAMGVSGQTSTTMFGKSATDTHLTYLLNNMWEQYRVTMDEDFLREKLFHLLKGTMIANYQQLILEEDGKLHAPLSASPEYIIEVDGQENQRYEDCNYTLSLIRWNARVVLEAAERLGIEGTGNTSVSPSDVPTDRLVTDSEVVDYAQDVMDRLVDYPVDESEKDTGFLIGKYEGAPIAYEIPHRHWSHLFMIYPLYEYTFSNDDPIPGMADKSFNNFVDVGTPAFKGYSLAAVSTMSTMQGKAQQAVGFLNDYFENTNMGTPNTLYTEGGQPVIETPLLTATSIMHMVMMAYNGQINIFRGIPDTPEWNDAEFSGLRADGGFVVSAKKTDGQLEFVEITSLAGEPCQVNAPFDGEVKVKSDSGRDISLTKVEGESNTYQLDLQAGETAVLYTEDDFNQSYTSVEYTQNTEMNWGV